MSTDQVKNGFVVSLRGFPIYVLDVSYFNCAGQLGAVAKYSSLAELIAYELNSGGGLRAQAPNKNNRVLGLHHISYLELWCEMDFYKFPFDKHVSVKVT